MEKINKLQVWKENNDIKNRNYCSEYVTQIIKRNKEAVDNLNFNKETYLLYSKEEQLVLFLKLIYPIAVSENDDSKFDLLVDFGIDELTTRYFIDIDKVISDLQTIEKKTFYIFNYGVFK